MKSTAIKKITRATIKSFIKTESKKNNLYIKQKSSFDGMVDAVMPQKGGFKKVEEINMEQENTFGINGLWLVGSSRDYFTVFSDEQYIGYEIYNCCGSSILASKKNITN